MVRLQTDVINISGSLLHNHSPRSVVVRIKAYFLVIRSMLEFVTTKKYLVIIVLESDSEQT